MLVFTAGRTRRNALAGAAALLATVALTGCGSAEADSSADPTTTPSPSASTSAAPTSAAPPKPATPEADVALAITVEGRTITPAPSRVKVPEGGLVRLTVTSDVDNELHVHGVELYKDLKAGKPTTVTFTADQSGLFEVETHEEPVLLLTQLQVQ